MTSERISKENAADAHVFRPATESVALDEERLAVYLAEIGLPLDTSEPVRQFGTGLANINYRLTAGGRRQLREVQSGSSYLAQNDLRAHFGLGAANGAERLEIRWPSGATERVEQLPANHVITVREGEGVVGRMPLGP